MEHKIEKLNYSFDALESHIDKETMEIHHDKHYAGYVTKLNTALEGNDELMEKTTTDLLRDLSIIPDNIKTAVVNNGGGAINHEMFWKILKKDIVISGEIQEVVDKKFGSFDDFKKEFSDISAKLFGSGWAWLVVNNGELEIMTTTGHGSPISEGKKPVLVLDLWEHAYYLKYQNRRPEYIEAFWSVVNWDQVNEYYKKAV
jgi:superoxide dismutase, Fe-Mn family